MVRVIDASPGGATCQRGGAFTHTLHDVCRAPDVDAGYVATQPNGGCAAPDAGNLDAGMDASADATMDAVEMQ